mmetsp:Transcript_121583/g.389037  ORF Transcript_121583/g.389037 Transcript_121583/m.389037 type:complete len:636 (+) Transcript_121583:30-1937(+)
MAESPASQHCLFRNRCRSSNRCLLALLSVSVAGLSNSSWRTLLPGATFSSAPRHVVSPFRAHQGSALRRARCAGGGRSESRFARPGSGAFSSLFLGSGAALLVISRSRWACNTGRPHHGLVPRRAEGSDFAVIRFRIPGFDDLSQLPRVMVVFLIGLLVYNRVAYPPSLETESMRAIIEILAVVLAVLCWALPWAGGRLEEAARRQVSTRTNSRQAGVMQTLAISEELPMAARTEVAWASTVLLRSTNADGVAVWSGGRAVGTRGLLKQLRGSAGGGAAVLQGLDASWPVTSAELDGYCSSAAGLDAFPEGALPRAVLPGDTQSVVAKPLPGGGLLVLWSALPRAFERAADRRWVARMAAKLGGALHPEGAESRLSPGGAERCFDRALLLGGDASGSSESRDPFALYASEIRTSPIPFGLLGVCAVLYSRLSYLGMLYMGADTGETRADLVAGVLALVLLAQGSIWLSETPNTPELQDTSTWENVEELQRFGEDSAASRELKWVWDTLSACTRVSSLVVFWRGACVTHAGLARSAASGGIPPYMGALCEEVMKLGKGKYLAQLPSYPSKVQFLEFLPEKTRGLLLTPMRPAPNAPVGGIMILGVDSVRAVGNVDQAWIGALAEKLAVSLDQAEQR